MESGALFVWQVFVKSGNLKLILKLKSIWKQMNEEA